MANCITRHIPNAVTCCNLFSGCIASVMAFNENYTLAISFIILGAVFDFFDGMLARLFKVSGPLGKELDSLADDITFGFAPSAIVFSLFKEVHYPDFLLPVADYMPYTAFLISVFSALRLGKFNIDPRQSSSFIGMPTPANALFWGSLTVGAHSFLISDSFNAAYLFILVVIMSLLLVAEIPMFSLKFKSLAWKQNKVSYIFLIVCIPLLAFFKISSFAAIILWYIILSLLTKKRAWTINVARLLYVVYKKRNYYVWIFRLSTYYFSADYFYRLHYIRQHSACIVRDRQASPLPESNIYPPKTKYIYPDSSE